MEQQCKNLPHYLSAEKFYRFVAEILHTDHAHRAHFALVTLDFDNFNFINDLFSYETGDTALRRITEYFSGQMADGEFFSRIHADHFVFLVHIAETQSIVTRFCNMTDTKSFLTDILPAHYTLVSSGGIVYLSEYQENLPALLDKANFARKQAKGNHANTFLLYDKKKSEDLEWRKAITMMMETALQEREFEMYLQPKILIKSGQLVGAEALVRWNSKKYGMIYPDRFIPILEQNGFVRQLDFFMLGEACAFLRKSIDGNLAPLPISVNFSKVHIRTDGFVERVFHTVNRYRIPTHLIEIEFTENIYLGDFQLLVEIASALKYLGFKVALDDFGSAYSSLIYLKDLPLDVIKIDKGFLNSSTNNDKGRLIIAKVVELIKSLRLVSVMEGVETDDEVEFLKKLSCDLGQGYFYAKPMPKTAFADFIKDNSPLTNIENYLKSDVPACEESYLSDIPQEFQMDNWELYTLGQNIDMGLMKGYLDGEATVQYVNARALEYLGYTRQEFREIFHNSIAAFTHPDDVFIVQKNAEQLIRSGKPLQFKTRAIRKDGKVIVLQGRSSCVIDSQGRPIGIHAFQDVTEELERTEALQRSLRDKIVQLETVVDNERKSREALRISEERYRLIVEQSDDIVFTWDFADDSIAFSEKFQKRFHREPIQLHVSTNPAIRVDVHPADLPLFEAWVQRVFCKSGSVQAEFRMRDDTGRYYKLHVRSTSIDDVNGLACKAVGVFTNITALKTASSTNS
ncbi:MAG: EAL domain-containing protein [Ruthenibacterium sp.]